MDVRGALETLGERQRGRRSASIGPHWRVEEIRHPFPSSPPALCFQVFTEGRWVTALALLSNGTLLPMGATE
jgi:hypothetical protein